MVSRLRGNDRINSMVTHEQTNLIVSIFVGIHQTERMGVMWRIILATVELLTYRKTLTTTALTGLIWIIKNKFEI